MGPGTHLERLIPDSLHYVGCDCHSYAMKMNAWGVLECRDRLNEIADTLVRHAKSPKITRHFPAFFTRPVARCLVREAIRRAERDQKFAI